MDLVVGNDIDDEDAAAAAADDPHPPSGRSTDGAGKTS